MSTWWETEVFCQQLALTSQTSKWAMSEADTPVQVKPSYDSSHSQHLDWTLKRNSGLEWPS